MNNKRYQATCFVLDSHVGLTFHIEKKKIDSVKALVIEGIESLELSRKSLITLTLDFVLSSLYYFT